MKTELLCSRSGILMHPTIVARWMAMLVGRARFGNLARSRRDVPGAGGRGPFGRLRSYGAGADQDPVDGGPGRGGLVVVGQVPSDGVGTGVQARVGELLAQPYDELDGRRRGGLG